MMIMTLIMLHVDDDDDDDDDDVTSVRKLVSDKPD